MNEPDLMSQDFERWQPKRAKRIQRMTDLRRQGSDALQDSTETLEAVAVTIGKTARTLPWMLAVSAVVTTLAAVAIIYEVMTNIVMS